ncbi:hypothetical protein BFJ69_g15099 [Fusarium oxysporum]|uniref:Aminoglycoside phosphotransferase domain-containing protein n=1 Tax=Fusarium oxysporum TaxID=5507 RepID=A0A420MFI5_FUSOX|nr:hypothetical protein BFJ69_g15099 [Fusarium oxysporum]
MSFEGPIQAVPDAEDGLEPADDRTPPFQWPSSSPPSSANIAKAAVLCQTLDVNETSISISPFNHSGWSAQDCIKIDLASQSFLVKIPRYPSPQSILLCNAEAVRASWAASVGAGPSVVCRDESSGAFVMAFINGQTLTPDLALRNLPAIMELLRKFHTSTSHPWMNIYSPIATVEDYLCLARDQATMTDDDTQLIEAVIAYVKASVGDTTSTLAPCHNDFHCHNIIVDGTARLWAIDLENVDLGDPMWDLAYLSVNLEMEPLGLAEVYGSMKEDRNRLGAYYLLAIAHCATWSITHGQLWFQHYRELMVRLRKCWNNVSFDEMV